LQSNDLRSVPDRILKLYLYSLGAWAMALLGFFFVGNIGVALSLCFPLSLYLGVVTLWWWTRTQIRFKKKDLIVGEVTAGVQTVGRILAGGSMLPGIIFLSNDPLEPANWGTFAGIAALAAIAWFLVHLASRFNSITINIIVLVCSWIALPINATGAVSVQLYLAWLENLTHIGNPLLSQ